MKTLLRGAIGPALIVAILQCVIELVFPLAALGQPFKQRLSMAYAMVALSQTTVLLGAAMYAGFLRRRSGASLPACAVGGALVGFLANLASQVAKTALLCVLLAVVLFQVPNVNGGVWVAILTVMALSCLLAGIGGLVVGEVGGGAVGLLSRLR
jgi:hypothetical protein